jgi:hypothetical protein
MLIDAILIEVLKSDSNDSLYGFCEVKNDWEGTGFGYTGDVDYMFGSSRTVWLLERKHLYLLFLPMDFSFASLPLPLMVLCMLLNRNFLKLAEMELTIQALL